MESGVTSHSGWISNQGSQGVLNRDWNASQPRSQQVDELPTEHGLRSCRWH